MVHIFPCSRISRPIPEIYIYLSQIYECRNWETECYNSVLEITVSFLGIQKWEPGIYIGFSPALHLQELQCRGKRKKRNMMHASERRMRRELGKERRERAEKIRRS
jgi:hypothetical protein